MEKKITIIIIIILVFLICYILLFYCKSNNKSCGKEKLQGNFQGSHYRIENFSGKKNKIKIDKVYCVNLDDANDRYETIKKYENEIDIGITRFSAIDTRTYEKSSKYYNLLTDSAIKKLEKLQIDGAREHHEDLSVGAIGCYLSHYNIWKDAIKNNYKQVLVLEDDAKLYDGFYKKIIKIAENTPDDWDIILFGLYGIGTKVNNELDIYKVDKFISTHCYLINIESISKIIDDFIPIDVQIDFTISKFIPDINVYGSHIISQDSKKFKSQIQVSLKNEYQLFA